MNYAQERPDAVTLRNEVREPHITSTICQNPLGTQPLLAVPKAFFEAKLEFCYGYDPDLTDSFIHRNASCQRVRKFIAYREPLVVVVVLRLESQRGSVPSAPNICVPWAMGELLRNVDSCLLPNLSGKSSGVTLKNDTEH